ncbi:GerAB/ArcD/ProY family transporter [Caldalkalibacillus mannanilyticus]|uniref:GerAB/ArcD/ProY family transporter n=1 Tax=Caldalkalibacillus mannanilyticus TaxID=1418 RepID=UPI0004690DD0|nr:endospore germination permease [Caldalkalibacillus mannanilyticus]
MNEFVEKINMWQLFVLIIVFEIGSAVVVGIATEAGRDAWLAILLATGIGLLLIRLFIYILSAKKGKNLFEIMELILGKYVTLFITGAYILYFLYIASRVLRDFLELLVTDVFPNTPIEVMSILFMLVVIYILYLGPEVLARTTEIFFPYILLLLFVIPIFLMVGEEVQLDYLKPVLAEGFKPIINAIFPALIGFPFGETIVFTLLMSSVTNAKHLPRVGMGAILLSGLILSFFTFLKLTVLGEDMSSRATFPLLNATREISLANFIERLDPLVVFIMMLGIFVKVSVFFFGGLKGLEYIFHIPFRYFSLPIGIILALFAVLISSDFAEHIEEGLEFVPMYLHIPFQVVIPLLLGGLVVWMKKKKGVYSRSV